MSTCKFAMFWTRSYSIGRLVGTLHATLYVRIDSVSTEPHEEHSLCLTHTNLASRALCSATLSIS